MLDARVLNGDLPHYTEPSRARLDWLRLGRLGEHGRRSSLADLGSVEFPFAELYLDESFPGSVSMTAFNPFIPLNDRDSSIPAFFEVRVDNTMSSL